MKRRPIKLGDSLTLRKIPRRQVYTRFKALAAGRPVTPGDGVPLLPRYARLCPATAAVALA